MVITTPAAARSSSTTTRPRPIIRPRRRLRGGAAGSPGSVGPPRFSASGVPASGPDSIAAFAAHCVNEGRPRDWSGPPARGSAPGYTGGPAGADPYGCPEPEPDGSG